MAPVRAILYGAIGGCIIGSASHAYYSSKQRKTNFISDYSDKTLKVKPYELTSYTYLDDRKYTLKQVNIVFRHGARTPLLVPPYWSQTEYKKELLDHPEETHVPHHLTTMDGSDVEDSKIEKAYAKRGLLHGGTAHGQLTSVGAKQMHTLGENLRRIYVDNLKFLQPTFNPDEVHVRTSNMNRTLESARCVNAGLFEVPDDNSIPIYTVDSENEIIYPNYFSCPVLKNLSRWAWDDPDKIPGLKEEREHVQKHLGISTDDHKVHFVEIRDNLAAEDIHGITHNKPNASIMKKIENSAISIMHQVFAGSAGDEESERTLSLQLSIGPLIEQIVTHIEDSNAKKMYMFSGHDTSIIPLLTALGVWESHWPYYGSNVSFELWESTSDKKDKFVRVLYNGESQKIQKCDDVLCPMSDFLNAVKNVRISPSEYQEKCSVNDEELQATSLPGIKP